MSANNRYNQIEEPLVQCGRRISCKEIDEIVEICHLFPNLSFHEMMATVCENLSWFSASGTPKTDACAKLLRKLEKRGLLSLPQKREISAPVVKKRPKITARTEERALLDGALNDYQPIQLHTVEEKEEIRLFNEYLHRYHYLGETVPFGCYLRYFVSNREHRLGCVLFAGAAKALGARDRWIGWTDNQRLQNLAWVINNTRFLLFPWVKIKNLASHVLGQMHRRISDDWYRKWGYEPVLLETFVNPQNHAGSCYKAAGWQHIGMTTGEGLVRKGKHYSTSPKLLFANPLVKDFRTLLCRTQDEEVEKRDE